MKTHHLLNTTYSKAATILVLFFATATQNYAQKLAVYTGISSFSFFDITDDQAHEFSIYSSSKDFYIGVGLEDYQGLNFPLKMSLQYERTTVDAFATSDFSGARNKVDATTSKSLLSLAVYPKTVDFYGPFAFDIGLLGSMLISESVSGTRSSLVGGSPIETNLEDKDESFNCFYSFGIALRPEFEYPIGEKLWFCANYAMNINLINEFKDFPKPTKTIRHFFGIGLKTQI